MSCPHRRPRRWHSCPSDKWGIPALHVHSRWDVYGGLDDGSIVHGLSGCSCSDGGGDDRLELFRVHCVGPVGPVGDVADSSLGRLFSGEADASRTDCLKVVFRRASDSVSSS